MDGVELEILWSNLIGIVDERAKALQRIAFSPVVREAGDLAVALFDRRGRMVAQANTGTPGHINSLAIAGAHLVAAFGNRLAPGDVLVTNDPWLSAGHFFDITVLTPIFDGDRVLAHIGSTIHHTDIGGYGIGAGARDVHEEGLWIPPLKLYRAGEPCEVLHAMIRSNVRTPDAVFGDLAAQVSSGRSASDRLIGMCRRYGLPDIEQLSDEIIARSEAATRAAIRKLKAGTFAGESRFDVPGGEIITLKAAVTIDPDAGEITVDFAGSSPQTSTGINVVLNYTHAYSTFAVRSCLNPDLPNNTGSLAPIKVRAPAGSIVNCSYPSPVNARHVVGMYVPMPILKALYGVMPERVIAEGSGAVWTMQIQGRRENGEPFTSSMFNYSGGMGARATKPGPSATCYPTGVAAVPVEILEAVMPIVFDRKELRPGSGDAGKSRGGEGQIIQFRMHTKDPWLLNAVASRLDQGPEGLGGGGMGARATKPGPSATCYPTGVAAVPVEILEAVMPIVFDRKELRPGSGGTGKSRGGEGQIIQFRMQTKDPWLLNAVPSRLDQGPEGLGGGGPGAAGRFLVNGKPVSAARKLTLAPDDVVLLETPGGGGYGPSAKG